MADEPNIEVLLLTYNRSQFLGSAIESILAQERPAVRFTVLDNGSTDSTPGVITKYADQGVKLIRREQNDFAGCWPELLGAARGPWTLLFHDDDLLHPGYLDAVSRAVAWCPDATVVVSSMRRTSCPSEDKWESCSPLRRYVVSHTELAAMAYSGFELAFPSTVYRTDTLRRISFNAARFGKVADRPMVIDAASRGCAIVLPDRWLQYRIHPSQVSGNELMGPFMPEVFALQAYYRMLLGDSPTCHHGRIFLRRNLRNLLSDFERLGLGATMRRSEYLEAALAAGAATRRSTGIGAAYMALTAVPRAIERALRMYLGKGIHKR
jgi:glycosyltransferase involved in cell wall biosynthesis